MQSRFTIVLMSIAGAAVLFGIGFALGLGVLSSPPAEKHKQIAVTTQPTKVTRPETTGQAKAEDKAQDNQKSKTAGNDRALTPLYPVAPGGSAAQADNGKSQQAANPAPQPQQPQQQVKAPAAEPAKTEAKTEAPAAPAPKNATPVSLEHRNACDVSACARAYKSFRESDCTYQPYSGPRQLCVNPPGTKEASRSHDGDRPSRRDVADRRDERRGDAHATDARGRVSDDDQDGPVLRRYHRDFTADGEDDRIMVVPADEGDIAGGGAYDDDQ